MSDSLFDEHVGQWGTYLEPHAFVSNSAPSTSVQAAEKVLRVTGNQRRRVFDAIALAGDDGATDLDVEAHLHLKGSSCRPRRIELAKQGLIEPTGHERDGARCWRLSEEGRALWTSARDGGQDGKDERAVS